LRGFKDEDKDLAAYLVPKVDTLEEMEEENIEFEWIREYTFEKGTGQQAGAFCFSLSTEPNQPILFNKVASRGSLLKYKDAKGQFIQPIRVTAHKREMSEAEVQERKALKKAMIYPNGDQKSAWEVSDSDD